MGGKMSRKMRKQYTKIFSIMTRMIIVSLMVVLTLKIAGCAKEEDLEPRGTRSLTDSEGRTVEIPQKVESVICLNVGALRYTCYMQAQDMVAGVEDYEKERTLSRPYNYINYDLFADLPVVGTNGEYYAEEIIKAAPDVIIMTAIDKEGGENLEDQTGIPVVMVPGSDSLLDEGAYETLRIMGEVYGREERAEELTAYMDEVKADLLSRTENIPEEEKPSVYAGGISYKGLHGFEGTEAGYSPLRVVNAKNLADEIGLPGAFNVDLEQIIQWDPDVIFIDYEGLELINESYAENPEYYNRLTAVREGRVYTQIPFRSYAVNLETALADAYYAGKILYPERFEDIDPEVQAEQLFQKFLGEDLHEEMEEYGYEFRQIRIGQ